MIEKNGTQFLSYEEFLQELTGESPTRDVTLLECLERLDHLVNIIRDCDQTSGKAINELYDEILDILKKMREINWIPSEKESK